MTQFFMTQFFSRHLCFLFLVLIVFALGTVDSHAAGMDDSMLVQLTYGIMVIPNEDPQVDGGDYDISLLGVAVQKPFGGGLLKYGIETGAFFNWQSEIRSFSASGGGGGGSVAVSVDIESFLFDFFGGGYVSLEPAKWFRLYLGAGPLLIYGYRTTQEDDPIIPGVTHTVSESGLSVGVYGRTGIDLIFAEKVLLGAGVRGTKTGLSFEETSGKVNIEGLQYYAGISFYFQ